MPIHTNQDVCGGKPCIAGTRISVATIGELYEAEYADTKGKRNDLRALQAAIIILDDYPKLTLQDIFDCLTYTGSGND